MEPKTETFRHNRYEIDPSYNADAYKMARYSGIAWDVLGWEVVADEETEWSGFYVRTGELLAIMRGDDRVFHFSPDDVTPITNDEFCGGCGQIGCGHGGR